MVTVTVRGNDPRFRALGFLGSRVQRPTRRMEHVLTDLPLHTLNLDGSGFKVLDLGFGI